MKKANLHYQVSFRLVLLSSFLLSLVSTNAVGDEAQLRSDLHIVARSEGLLSQNEFDALETHKIPEALKSAFQRRHDFASTVFFGE